MYDMTLHALKAAKIERMWFVVSMKLARLHVDAKHVAQACAALEELHKSCTLPGTEVDDPAKAAQLIEIYAMRIEVGSWNLEGLSGPCFFCWCSSAVNALAPQLVPLLKQADPASLPRGFLIDEKTIHNRMQSLIRSAAISDPRIMG
jgi:hypothetical protein